MKRTVLAALLVSVAIPSLSLAGNLPLYFGGFLARPLAAGGAVTAVPSAEYNHLYNPAATVFTDDDESYLVLWGDALRLFYGLSFLNAPKESFSFDRFNLGVPLCLLLEQASYGNRHWEVKLSLWEQLPSLKPNTASPTGSGDPVLHNEVSTLTGSVNLPFLQGLSAGATLQAYNLFSGADQGAGYSLGLYWQPAGFFSLGVFYFGMPSGGNGEIRVPLEHLYGDSLNAGASLKIEKEFLFFSHFYANLDIRDVANRFLPRIGGEAGIDIFKYLRFSAAAGFASSKPLADMRIDDIGFSIGAELNFFDPRAGGNFYARATWAKATHDAAVPAYGSTGTPYYDSVIVVSLGYARFTSF